MITRRDFLVTSAAAAVLTAASRASSADDPTPNGKKLGWAIVGIGSLSRGELLPAIAKCEKSQLSAIVTGHPQRNMPIAEKFGLKPGSVYTYENFDAIANDPQIDIVYIVLPNGMHRDYTIRALKAGKHVLCEKPMANTSVQCQEMIDAAKSSGKKLMIAYRIRREPHNMRAIEICRNREQGRPRFIVGDHGFHIGDPTVWRLNKALAGGGAIMDIGIYCINAARYLTGEEPVSVTAQRLENPGDPRFKEVEEAITWTMQFPSGCMTTMTTSYNIAGTNRYRVICERGLIDLEPATLYHGNVMRVGRLESPPVNLPDVDQFALQMDYFSDCVMNNVEPITPGEEGLADLKIIEAIYQSAQSGQTVKLA